MRCRHRAIEFVAPLGLLLALTLVFFWKLLFTNLIYPGYDAFTYFYPYQTYAAEALRNLRLPLWNPRIFTGVPFLANLQAGLLYLPNWPLFLSTSAPKAYAYSVALHVFLAGCSTYLLARFGLGLGHYGALSAGLVFMFGGFLAGQVGHINQLNAAAWLPPLLLLVHLACCTRRRRYTVVAGVFLALQFLAGHAQESFMTMVALGSYILWKAMDQMTPSLADEVPGWGTTLRRRWAELSGGLLILAAVIVIGVGLAAVQLVPSAELAAQSVRSGGVTYRQAVSFSLDPRRIFIYLLPNFTENPFYEYLGYVGVLGLLLALYGVAKRGKEPWVRFNLLLALGALVLAFGGYTPLYRLCYYLVPGFGLFRVPARWLMVYSLAMALLAGVGMDGLSRDGRIGRLLSAKELAFKAAGWWRGLGIGWRVALLAVGFAGLAFSPFLKYPPLPVLGLWLGTLGLAIVIFYLGVRSHRWSIFLLLLSVAVFGELFLASRNLELNLPIPPEAYTTWRPSGSFFRTDTGVYRVLSLSDALFDPGDLPETGHIFSSQLSRQQVASYVTALKNKEIIAPNLGMLLGLDSVDGYDGGLLPLKRYVQMEPLFLPAGQSAADGRLRERMSAFPSEKVLSLFNVKYLLADKVHDVWVEDVYYDLGNQVPLGQGDTYTVTAEGLPRFPVTSLGVISYLTGAEAIPDQAVVAEIEVTDTAGTSHKYELRAGIDTAQGEYGTANLGGVAHPMARIASHWRGNPAGNNYYTKLTLGSRRTVKSITVRYLGSTGQLHLQGVSLVDDLTKAHQSVTISASGDLELAYSGDVKIYRNKGSVARAFVVHRAVVAPTETRALALVRDPAFAPKREVVLLASQAGDILKELSASPGLEDKGPYALGPLPSEGEKDVVDIARFQPERVEVRADLGRGGFLVFSDAYYPGWKATVDGAPAKILRANYFFKGLYLPGGTHRVVLEYDPPSFKVGLAVSLLTALGIVLFSLARKRWR